VLEQQHANQSNVQTEIYAKEQERKKQVQEELSQRVAKETLEQNKVREEQRRVLEATKKQIDETKSVEMQYLQTKYDSLNEFKDSKQFAEWGFAAIGPFGPWLKDVEAKKAGKFESPDVAFAVAHLLTLGLEYKDSKGKETEYARFANDCIRGILRGEHRDAYEKRAMEKIQSILSKKKQKEPEESAEYMFVQDDGFPDIYAFISFEHIQSYYRLQNHKSTYSRAEREMLGIALVENLTMIRIQRKIPVGTLSVFYEAIPMSGRNQGRVLYFSPLDVYKSLR
jgi:hypothetical protein